MASSPLRPRPRTNHLLVVTGDSQKTNLAWRILPQSEAFYRKYVTDLGPNPNHQGLHYFELSAEQKRPERADHSVSYDYS
jgi:hypothetical protein